ncbi:MAG: YciI family protein [Actinomycetota bacterium]|nr:YciI family protein [Actinomycetota bacterium]
MTDEEREIMVEADDEDELRAFAAQDPVVTTGTGRIKVSNMLAGFIRTGLTKL